MVSFNEVFFIQQSTDFTPIKTSNISEGHEDIGQKIQEELKQKCLMSSLWFLRLRENRVGSLKITAPNDKCHQMYHKNFPHCIPCRTHLKGSCWLVNYRHNYFPPIVFQCLRPTHQLLVSRSTVNHPYPEYWQKWEIRLIISCPNNCLQIVNGHFVN